MIIKEEILMEAIHLMTMENRTLKTITMKKINKPITTTMITTHPKTKVLLITINNIKQVRTHMEQVIIMSIMMQTMVELNPLTIIIMITRVHRITMSNLPKIMQQQPMYLISILLKTIHLTSLWQEEVQACLALIDRC